ncbi:hypothetical protein Barb6XT_03128 [Bacteroidales bacterium Barb6XT]|nr:hypothetical protein Barb6XT_03128 [Bacteroidales bacterium Barb6XT]
MEYVSYIIKYIIGSIRYKIINNAESIPFVFNSRIRVFK